MGNKLLLADDSITIQKVVGIIFANEDYELTIVDNGNAALEKAAAVKPDVMLIDALMPGKSGYEVCEAVRRDPAMKGTPILLLTGAFEPFDENKARQSGADDFISKPFESQQLIEKVKALMEIGRARAAAPQPVAAPVAPAPAVAPPVVEPPPVAADIWGEATAEPAIVFEPAAPVAPAVAEMSDAFSFADVNVDEEPHVSGGAVVGEATAPPAEDDLWGAFELEEVSAGEEAEFGTVVEVEEVVAAGMTEEFETFAFDEAVKPQPQAAPSLPSGQPEEAVSWVSKGEEAFSFVEEPAVGAAPVAETSAFAVEVEEPAVAVESDAEPEPFAPKEASPFAIEFETEAPAFAPTPFVEPPVAPVLEPPPAPIAPAAVQSAPQAAAAPVPSGEMTISEEQLAQLVAKISRDIIEKIAWEVVPDLAETLIREEIRKIKEGR
jgi:CheY-like chemotaxis protein